MAQNQAADRRAGRPAGVEEDGLLNVKHELLVICVCWFRDCNSHTTLCVCSQERGGQVDRMIKVEKGRYIETN